MQTKGLYKTVIGTEDAIRRPNNLPENPTDEDQAAHTAEQVEFRI